MVGKFLNLNDDDLTPSPAHKIGAGLKSKKKAMRPRADATAVAAAGKANGFDRTTGVTSQLQGPRRGRPPLNEDMTYWRIYIAADLRDKLNQLRDEEGRRLNDVLADMLAVYQK